MIRLLIRRTRYSAIPVRDVSAGHVQCHDIQVIEDGNRDKFETHLVAITVLPVLNSFILSPLRPCTDDFSLSCGF